MRVNDTSRIAIDTSTVMLQILALLTDDSRGVIYGCKMFKAQATGWMLNTQYLSFASFLA